MGSQVSTARSPAVDKPQVLTEKVPLPEDASLQAHPMESPFDSLSIRELDKWSEDFDKNPTFALSRLVLSKADPVLSLSSRAALIHDAKIFNLRLKGTGANGEYPGPRVNQASSGRCWLFATTNVLRYSVIEQLKLGEFELSQNYLFFYDKLEKANYYLENILELLDEPLNGRLLAYLNQAPVNDGGQWDMAVNLIEKYGVIPKTLYPEAFSSTASSRLDSLLTSKLREYAVRLRAAAKRTNNVDDLRKSKAQFMSEIFSTLSIALGSPPKPDQKLTWEYYDRDDKFHSWTGTPREFYAQFGKRKGMDPKDSFSIINDPRNEYGKLYSVERLGNVWKGKAVRYVNAPITVLEDAVIAGIKANTPLFFGCDVGKASNTPEGVMDCQVYDLKAAYGFELGMNKAQRLETGESSMTHAMVITAVHLDESGRPLRYKVENSWSESAGEKGWFMMTADWFKEYVFQVVVPQSIVDRKWSNVLQQEPVMLKPWDPMVSFL
uniref:Cysteine proteinase 1, mitochondrial n=1 Tax=Kwoniella bestiolae CBS 10118 TaxID=1296100 RepID=A0A1B9G6Q9_9TREE|nr:hypothetical protein I302_04379 [Kwoniella bestiolae CBS 10118]OCF26692.1 hypothetical protein I302_04379 [Kwoniella bestiolae CBS 10118]